MIYEVQQWDAPRRAAVIYIFTYIFVRVCVGVCVLCAVHTWKNSVEVQEKLSIELTHREDKSLLFLKHLGQRKFSFLFFPFFLCDIWWPCCSGAGPTENEEA